MNIVKRIKQKISTALIQINTIFVNITILNEKIDRLQSELDASNYQLIALQKQVDMIYEGKFQIEKQIQLNHEGTKAIKNEVHDLHENVNKARNEVHNIYGNINKVRDEVHNVYGNVNNTKDEVHNIHEDINKTKNEVHNVYENVVNHKREFHSFRTTELQKHKFNDYIFLDSLWNGVSQVKRNPEIIVSMTSYPERIATVKIAIESVMFQTLKADRIVLWLSKSDFPSGESELPSGLLKLKDRGLEICWCDLDIRSYKKILPAMKRFPDDIIITVDDDLIYRSTMIEELYDSFKKYPSCISAIRVHRIIFKEDGSIAPYKDWIKDDCTYIDIPRKDLFATTGAGTLFPPHCLPDETLNWNSIKELCPHADDIWVKAMSLINNISIVLVNKQEPLVYIQGTQDNGTLWKINCNRNDIQLEKVLERYSVAKENLQEKRAILSMGGLKLSDRRFFLECLNLDYPGMEKIKSLTLDGKYREARAAMAEYIRESMHLERFLALPYEKPENQYKYLNETDEEACHRVQRHIMVSVGIPCDFGEQGIIDWSANPTTNNYKEWTWQLNRHNELKMLAHQYLETGDEWLADTAAELILSWIQYASYPGECNGSETDCWRTIECGIRVGANWPYALAVFCHSKAFTDDLLVDWLKSIWQHGERLSNHYTSGNWLVMEMNGLAHIGIMFPQFFLSDKWFGQAFSLMKGELSNQFYPDGFQNELSTNYHDVVINNYQRMILTAKVFNIPIPEDMIRSLLNVCELDVKLMMPDGRLPDLNDGANLSVKEIFSRREQLLTEDNDIGGVIRWVTRGDMNYCPKYKSVELPWSGFFIMRTGWDTDSSWVLFDAAPFGRYHQHEDKLSVLFFSENKLLLTEGGNYAYDDSEMRQYVISTRSHNTVRVDGFDQNRRLHYKWDPIDINKKSEIETHIGSVWDCGMGKYSNGYGDRCQIQAIHERKVFFCKKPEEGMLPYLIVVDRMKSDVVHTYEWLWHIDSNAEVLETDNNAYSKKILFSEINIFFSTGSARLLYGQHDPEWQGFISTGTNQDEYREIPCVSVTAQSKELRMVTVLAPHRNSKYKNRIVEVKAGTSICEDKILLEFENGNHIILSEASLRQECINGVK